MKDCITNRDPGYLKAHADMEHEADLDDTITATLGTLICGPRRHWGVKPAFAAFTHWVGSSSGSVARPASPKAMGSPVSGCA